MSSSPPLSPKLGTLADFGGDLNSFLEHVEQYRQYTELKEQMNKTKKNLLLEKPPQPSFLDTEIKAQNFHNEPVSALVPDPSPKNPATLVILSPSFELSSKPNYLASHSKTISPAKIQESKSNKMAVNSSFGIHSNSMKTCDTSEEVPTKLTSPVHNHIISNYVHDFDQEKTPLVSHWKTLLKAQYGKVHKYACKACGKEDEYNSIKSHIETTHMARGHFPCSLCVQIFNSKEEMQQHNSIVHREMQHKENTDPGTEKNNSLIDNSCFIDVNATKVYEPEPALIKPVAPMDLNSTPSFDPTRRTEPKDKLENVKNYQLIPKSPNPTMKLVPSRKFTFVLKASQVINPVKLGSSPDFPISTRRFHVTPVHLKTNALLENKIVIDHEVIKMELVPVKVQSQEVLANTLLAPNMVDSMHKSNDGLVQEDDFKKNTDKITHNVSPIFNSDHRVNQQSTIKSTTMSLTCSICGRTMKNSAWLSAHIFSGHNDQQTNCSICTYTTDTRRKLTQHIKGMHFKTYIIKCSQCDLSFTSKQNQISHKDENCLSRKVKGLVYIQIIRWSRFLCVIIEAHALLRNFWIL